ncbi:2-oxoglutarate dehydrogenase E1 subunit family protein, partial [Cellulomonas biazotea]
MTQKAEPDSTRADFGANEWLVDELYEQYKQDRNAVDPAWWDFFDGYKPDEAAATAPAAAGTNGTPAPAAAAPAPAPAPSAGPATPAPAPA